MCIYLHLKKTQCKLPEVIIYLLCIRYFWPHIFLAYQNIFEINKTIGKKKYYLTKINIFLIYFTEIKNTKKLIVPHYWINKLWHLIVRYYCKIWNLKRFKTIPIWKSAKIWFYKIFNFEVVFCWSFNSFKNVQKEFFLAPSFQFIFF